MASKRHGLEIDCLKKRAKGSLAANPKPKKRFFSSRQIAASKKEAPFDCGRKTDQTEETSIKFSNLSAEEITAYRAGKASHQLRFELSFCPI